MLFASFIYSLNTNLTFPVLNAAILYLKWSNYDIKVLTVKLQDNCLENPREENVKNQWSCIYIIKQINNRLLLFEPQARNLSSFTPWTVLHPEFLLFFTAVINFHGLAAAYTFLHIAFWLLSLGYLILVLER
jgi:hypothetical protein